MSSSSPMSSTSSVVAHANVATNLAMKNEYVCLFHLITAGLLDENLGSDEQEIIEIICSIIDVDSNKNIALFRQYVRPSSIQSLTDETRQSTGIDENLLFSSLFDLDSSLKKFDNFLHECRLHPDHGIRLTFLCENSLHLRQCLHPESIKRSTMTLPSYYWSYFDLRNEFEQCYKTSECSNINTMLQKLNLLPVTEDDYSMRQVRHMELIVNQMLNDGHRFEKAESIMTHLQHGLCSLEENIEENTVVRARGLPWQCTDQDVARFFRGLNIERGGVALCLSSQGRRNGEALVRFCTTEHRELALRRHKHHIGQRYIEVYKASGRDFLNVAGGSNSEAQAFLQRDGQVIIRMRGLPFDALAKDVIEFFNRGDRPIDIVDGEEGVLFVHYPDGRSTGDAFVMVKTEDQATEALLKHKETMGSRYIELFRSTTAEVQQVFRRSQDPKNFQMPMKDIPFTPLPMLPPEMLSVGNKRDCIRVRNLPVECGIEQILEFLGVHSQHIIPQGVHMVFNAHGQPSGEAFIQMDSETSSYNASMHKNNKYLFFNGKKRFIEVLQCSGEEMNQILLGLVPSNLIPNNVQRQSVYSPHRAGPIVPMSTVSTTMIPSTMSLPMSSASNSTNVQLGNVQTNSGSSSMVNNPMQTQNLHPNNGYYPLQVFYYPTGHMAPSIYLSTGHVHTGPMTLLVRGETGQY